MSRNSRFSAAVIVALVAIASLHAMSNGSPARSDGPAAAQVDVTALTLAAGKLPAQRFDAI
jgi:hypothetical protein